MDMRTITWKRSAIAAVPFVFVFWLAAALLVIVVHRRVEPHGAAAAAMVKTLVIVAMSGAYMKIAGNDTTLDHALSVGAIWLALAVTAEIGVSLHDHRGWFDLLGSPSSPWRNVLMFAWVVAPALFARTRHGE
jgi:FtsH-binding integral membrane protein